MRQRVGVLLCDDLIFSSRIAATARAQGLTVFVGKTPAQVVELARREEPACVVVDLNADGLDLAGLLDGLRRGCAAMPRVVGYGSHVLAEVLREARRLGCDPVLPRSAFVEAIETDLAGWCEP